MGKKPKQGAWFKAPADELPAKWTTGEAPKVCTKCDYVDDTGFAIQFHPDVLSAVFYLCREVKTEWQMLLVGAEVGQKVVVNGYYIPKQEVTASTVTNLEAIDREFIDSRDIVGTIHSHSDMGVFFSTVDDEFTNMSWIKHHVVVNNKHDFVAKSRYDLKCGGVKFVDSKVETMIPTSQAAEGSEKIAKKVYTPPVGGYNSVAKHGWDWNTGKKSGLAKDEHDYGVYNQGRYVDSDEYTPWWEQDEHSYIKVDGVWIPRDRVKGGE